MSNAGFLGYTVAVKISREEVLRIAKLSRLSLKDDEVVSMTKQLDAILEYVEQLERVDTAGVDPTAHLRADETPLRPDEPWPSLSQEEAVANAPKAAGGAFVVPRISGGES